MHQTLEELEADLLPLKNLIPNRQLQAKVIVGYIHGQTAILYWDILEIVKYEIVESDYEDGRYFSLITVKLPYGNININFEDLVVKQPSSKELLRELVEQIDKCVPKGNKIFYVDNTIEKCKEYLLND